MIRQYLSNKNESATVPKTKKISKLNKALLCFQFFSKIYTKVCLYFIIIILFDFFNRTCIK
jgi:hypothetical protein